MQRGLIASDVLDDVAARLRFYEEARRRNLPHLGAVFLAEDVASETVVGFVDVGLSLWDTRRRQFKLPKRPEGDWGEEPPSHLWLRPYISNLAVDARFRQRGVGRQLVAACEDEVRRWDSKCHSDAWLEVSMQNSAAIEFYERCGFEYVAETRGREVVKKRFTYESSDVRRALMKKSVLGAERAR